MSDCTLSRRAVRELDRAAVEEFGLPGIVLMENAGRNAAEILAERGAGVTGRVAVCCGKGNNGGDGFVIARHLDARGIDVRVLLFADSNALTGDAAVNAAVARQAGILLREFPGNFDPAALDDELQRADWIVDALLGTGTAGEVREPLATAIRRINAASARVLAIDLPSGLDCDTGEPLGPCVKADVTVTFVSKKPGFAKPSAVPYLGEVCVADIGVPRVLLERFGLPG
ncbi:MAG: NAD(P)H-hydrate epimerase [Planctomycetaceae bacterium]